MKLTSLAILALLVLTALRYVLAMTMEVTPEEAYYWMCARRLDWAFFDGPPGTAALVQAGIATKGSGALGIRLAFPMAAAAASVAAFLLGRAVFGTTAGIWTAIALNALPAFNEAAIHAGPAIPALAAVIYAARAAWRALNSRASMPWWITAGLSVGAGVQFHYAALAAWAGILLNCLLSRKRRAEFRQPGLYIAALLTAAMAAPLIVWNQSQNWAPFALGTLRTALRLDFPALAQALGGAAWALSIFLSLALAAVLALGAIESRSQLRVRFLVTWAAPFLLIWLYGALHRGAVQPELLLGAALLLPVMVHYWHNERITPAAISFALVTAAVSSALALAALTSPGPPWEKIALAAAKLRAESAPSSPDPIFLIAQNPADTAALNYHIRNAPGGKTTEVFLRESQDLSTQFGLWPRYDEFVKTEKPPDEFFRELSAANPYAGRTAIYVSQESLEELPQTITNAFERVTPAAALKFTDPAGAAHEYRLYLCENYQTMPL
jgi:4-amino-4-deoxy-L-arabinose transferase-like glycosyltransferase